MKSVTRTYFFLSLTAFLLTLLPMALYLHRYPDLAPFSLFANDCFYYLDVARNSQGMFFYTFDGIHPTNGFHPVWQFLLYLGVKYHYLDLNDPAHALIRLFYVNLLLLSVATSAFALVFARYLERKWVALLGVCPGWLWFLIAVSAPNYISNWSYLNGMETSVELVCLAFALLSYRPSMRTIQWLPAMSFLLGMTVLSRLDDVFFLLPILAFVIITRPRADRRIAVVLSAIPLTMIAAYLLYNLYSVGMAMPISGASKAGLALRGNLIGLIKVFLPTHWDQPNAVIHIGYSGFSEGFMRTFQMVVPMVVCALYMLRRRMTDRTLVDWLCVGVILKGAYNFMFVALWSQGHWYYGASVFTSNLVLSLALDYALGSCFNKSNGTNISLGWRRAGVFAEILVILFSFNAFVNNKLSSGFGYRSMEIFEGRARLGDMVRSAGGDTFVEFDDGILGFSTGMRTLSGIGLVLDVKASSARKQGHFLDLAVARGDQLFMADGAYADALEMAFSRQDSSRPNDGLYGIHGSEFADYSLESVAVDQITDVHLYRLIRKKDRGTP